MLGSQGGDHLDPPFTDAVILILSKLLSHITGFFLLFSTKHGPAKAIKMRYQRSSRFIIIFFSSYLSLSLSYHIFLPRLLRSSSGRPPREASGSSELLPHLLDGLWHQCCGCARYYCREKTSYGRYKTQGWTGQDVRYHSYHVFG